MIESIAFELAARFELSWSHFVTLLGVSDARERRFYEVEAASGSWGVRELDRQINSALYERLALSRDKEEIKRWATAGLLPSAPQSRLRMAPHSNVDGANMENRPAQSPLKP